MRNACANDFGRFIKELIFCKIYHIFTFTWIYFSLEKTVDLKDIETNLPQPPLEPRNLSARKNFNNCSACTF